MAFHILFISGKDRELYFSSVQLEETTEDTVPYKRAE
jgi:hypothetical protein